MKYGLFCGQDYYPNGFNDFVGSFASIQECKTFLLEKSKTSSSFVFSDDMKTWEWYEIVSSDFELVSRGTIRANRGEVILEETDID